MERTYIVNAYEEVDNYGVYECLKATQKDHIKSYGAISGRQYYFCSDIADHYDTATKLKKLLGSYNFYFSIYAKSETITAINIYRLGREEYVPTKFEFLTIKRILQEVYIFQVEGNQIEVSIPAEVSLSEEEEQSEDAETCIESVEAREYEQTNKFRA